MSKFNRAILFVNGELADPSNLTFSDEDYLVAVDNGVRHALAFNLTPHILVGDLDSIDPDLVTTLQEEGVKINRFSPQKDQTDLELALDHVVKKGFKRIMLVAASGGRLDQTLMNLDLLIREDLQELDIWMDDGKTRAFPIHHHKQFAASINDTISLIPFCEPVTGIKTEGLAYPLNGETLYPHKTRGISNQANSKEISITFNEGILICIHIRKH